VSVGRRHLLRMVGGGLVAGLVPAAARADSALDVRILQTASSLEALAAIACTRIGAGALAGFAEAAGGRHVAQKQAFQAQTVALGGQIQDAPNPKFESLLAGADGIAAATTIEKAVVDTYIANLSMVQDMRAKELVAAAMAVAAQHLALLRVAGADPGRFRIPFRVADLAKLAVTAASDAIPDALHQVGGSESTAEPTSGAVA
jgi:hypothetical protein